MASCALQPFDGSLGQAQGILSVEKATFGECPYSPEQIACLLNQPTQHAIVAMHGDRVLGFVASFETATMAGHNLEVDLLAVHPDAQAQGIGRRLLTRAGALSTALGARRARGLVGASNPSSQKAFLKADYIPSRSVHLLVCDPSERTASAGQRDLIGVSPLSQCEELRQLGLADRRTCLSADQMMSSLRPRRHEVCVAKQNDALVGFCETLWVDTLLYKGIWIESLRARRHDRRITKELVSHVMDEARAAGLDRVGVLVDQHTNGQVPLLEGLGFRGIGEYRWHEFRGQHRSEG